MCSNILDHRIVIIRLLTRLLKNSSRDKKPNFSLYSISWPYIFYMQIKNEHFIRDIDTFSVKLYKQIKCKLKSYLKCIHTLVNFNFLQINIVKKMGE